MHGEDRGVIENVMQNLSFCGKTKKNLKIVIQ